MKNSKKLLISIIVTILIVQLTVYLDIGNILKQTYSVENNENTATIEYGTYENARTIIQKTMKDYYIKEPYVQYHSSRAYNSEPPEDALHNISNLP